MIFLNYFSENELKFIREHPEYPDKELALLLSKTTDDITAVKKTLGIKNSRQKNWSKEEVQYLINNYGKKSYREMMSVLHRTQNGIANKAYKLGISEGKGNALSKARKWTKEESEYLINNSHKSNLELSEEMGRSVSTICQKQIELGIRKPKTKNWTQKEISYLYKYGETKTCKELSKALHRPPKAINAKARRLGIFKNNSIISYVEISRSFKINPSTVSKIWAKKYGMPARLRKLGKNIRYEVDVEEFWKWALLNKGHVPFDRYEKGSLLPEPKELGKLIEAKKNKVAKNSRKHFTVKEKENIKKEFYEGHSLTNIAMKHGRTIESIKHVIKGR